MEKHQADAEKKYKLIPEGDFYRVVALKDFVCQGRKVKAGDFGGYVQTADNLSQDGSCWIFDNAMALDDSRVMDDACLAGKARAGDLAKICDYATVVAEARVGGRSIISGFAHVEDAASVWDDAIITDKARVTDDAIIMGEARIFSNAEVSGLAVVKDRAAVGYCATVFGFVVISGDTKVELSSVFYGHPCVRPERDFGDCASKEQVSSLPFRIKTVN